nr:220 kDa polyprotein [Abalone asfa-like virus]
MIKSHLFKTIKGGAEDVDKTPAERLRSYNVGEALTLKYSLITKIAEGLKALGLPINISDSTEETAANVRKAIKKTFANAIPNNKSTHIKLCESLAQIINSTVTPNKTGAEHQMIPLTLEPDILCKNVYEVILGLTAEISMEFVEVYTNVTQSLQNIKAIDQLLSKLYDSILARARKPDKPETHVIDAIDEVRNRILAERDRQVLILEGYLNVNIGTPTQELQAMLADRTGFYKTIKDLGINIGSPSFSKVLVGIFSDLGNLTGAAASVHEKLKKLGISIDQYLKTTSWAEFDQLLDAKRSTLNTEDLTQLEIIVGKLRETFNNRDEFSAELKNITGGADNESDLDRQIKKSRTNRMLVLKQYIDRTTRDHERLLAAIKAIGPRLGKQVMITEKLGEFRDALNSLADWGVGSGINYIVIGFYTSPNAVAQKNVFLDTLENMRQVLEDLKDMQVYAQVKDYFLAILDPVVALKRSIENYGNVMAKNKLGGADDSDVSFTDLGMPEIAKTNISIIEAVNIFKYYYFISRIRLNLKTTRDEISEYAKDYAEIIGDAIAGKISSLEIEKTNKMKQTYYPGIDDTWISNNEGKWTAYKKGIEEEYNVKINFYKAMESLDLYLQAFTDGIIGNPDDVADIKRIITGVSIISKWFNEQTGDDLVRLYEMFPDDGDNLSGLENEDFDGNDKHYYAMIKEKFHDQGDKIGHVYPADIQKTKDIRNMAGSVLNNFQALKNIISLFVKVGEVFGNKEIRLTSPLPPTRIYKSIIDYLKTSVISCGFSHHQVTTGVAAPITFDPCGLPTVDYQFNLQERGVNRAIPNLTGHPSFQGSWDLEDRMFVFMMKAMSAKILTVIGVADMVTRPAPVSSLAPIREIIGGNIFSETPEVITECTELYFRLTRLAEFYKHIFHFNDHDAACISLLPETNGVFADFISLFFMQITSSVDVGDYTLTEMKQIIIEINKLYNNFAQNEENKTPKGVVMRIIDKFVIEINRRYALVKRTEYEKYEKFMSETRRYIDNGMVNTTDLSILPGETELEYKRVAPSDRFVNPTLSNTNVSFRPGKHDMTDPSQPGSTWKILEEFRTRISELFSGAGVLDTYGGTTYNGLLKQSQAELAKETNVEKRFNLVTKLIQSSKSLLTSNSDCIMLFHETVVYGLNVLAGFYSKLNGFRTIVETLNPERIKKVIYDTLMRYRAGTGVQNINIIGSDSLLNNVLNSELSALEKRLVKTVLMRDTQLIRQYWPSTEWRDTGPGTIPLHAARFYGTMGAFFNHTNANAPGGINYARTDELDCEAFAGMAIDYGTLAEMLLTNLFMITGDFDKLINVDFPNSQKSVISVDYSNFRSTVLELMEGIKYFFKILKPQIPKEMADQYESRDVQGSIYWLEENFINDFIEGTHDIGGRQKNPRVLDNVFKTLNRSLIDITTPRIILKIQLGAPGNHSYDVFPDPVKPSLHGTFARLIYYDNQIKEGMHSHFSGVTMPSMTRGTDSPNNKLLKLVSHYDPATKTQTPIFSFNSGQGLAGAPAPIECRRLQLYTDHGPHTHARSIMMTLNQMIFHYLHRYFDKGSERIYVNLLNSINTGILAPSLNDFTKTHPDLSNRPFGIRADPAPGALLLHSLALIIRNLEQIPGGSNAPPKHLHQTLQDVPLYMRETMKATLPTFQKEFDIMFRYTQFLRQVITNTDFNLTPVDMAKSYYTPASWAQIQEPVMILNPSLQIGIFQNTFTDDTWPGPVKTIQPGNTFIINTVKTKKDAHHYKKYFLEMLVNLGQVAQTLGNGCSTVYKELVDDPIYMQVSENSIEEYQNTHNKMPLMPLSSMMMGLKPVSGIDAPFNLIPSSSVIDFDQHTTNPHTSIIGSEIGTPYFKWLYGTRKVLNTTGQITMDDIPGSGLILDKYNKTTQDRFKIDEKHYVKFVHHLMKGTRMLVNLHGHMTKLLPTRHSIAPVWHVKQDNFVWRGAGTTEALSLYQLFATPNEVLAITENSFQDEEIGNIVKSIDSQIVFNRPRLYEQLANIMDINIMPVNVHGVMRSMEFANIYNYSYTFDQIITKMFKVSRDDILNLDLFQPSSDTRGAFVKLLLQPHAKISLTNFGVTGDVRDCAAPIGRIFRGDPMAGLDRPKFLSDQVFNKVLLCNLIPSKYTHDSAGISASGARREGTSGGPQLVNTKILIQQVHHQSVTDLIQVAAENDIQLWTIAGLNATYVDRDMGGANWGNVPIDQFRALGRTINIIFNFYDSVGAANRTALENTAHPIIEKCHELLYEMILLIQDIYQVFGTKTNSQINQTKYPTVQDAINRITTALAANIYLTGYAPDDMLDNGVQIQDANIAAVPNRQHPWVPIRVMFHYYFKFGLIPALTPIINSANIKSLFSRQVVVDALIREDVKAHPGRDRFNYVTVQTPGIGPQLIIPESYDNRFHKPLANPTPGNAVQYPLSQILTYQTHPNTGIDSIVEKFVSPQYRRTLSLIGKARFDSKFIRNLFFISNLHRVLRARIFNDLMRNDTRILTSNDIAVNSLTEYDQDTPFEHFNEQEYKLDENILS